jgi:hypothetical protein
MPPIITFCTTVKNRTQHLEQTLPVNMANNRQPYSRFVVLNYGSQDHLLDFIISNHKADLHSGKLVVYSFPTDEPFHVSHAKNLCARLGILEGADILVTLDADNFTGENFDQMVVETFKEPGIFLTPDHVGIRGISWESGLRPNRGFAGRLAVRAQDFIKAGGYNEVYDTWRGEDIDFNARMMRMGYVVRFIDNKYLHTIPHNAEVRFKEYPHARQYDREGAWKIDGKGNDTVVNFGKFGMGTVYKNFDPTPIVLGPVPTRIFGIGLHKTATTSLHKAFQILGFDSLHWGRGEAPLIWQQMNDVRVEPNERGVPRYISRSKTLERFYAACDLPIPLFYRELDKAYPGSKFILTVRAEEQWLKSVERLWDPEYNSTRKLWDIYPISNTLHKALYGRTDFDAETMLKRYRLHNAAVREYFKGRDDLLVMEAANRFCEWDMLCDFLDKPVPSVPYPIEHRTRVVDLGCSSDGAPEIIPYQPKPERDVLFPGPDHVPVPKPELGKIRLLPDVPVVFPVNFEELYRDVLAGKVSINTARARVGLEPIGGDLANRILGALPSQRGPDALKHAQENASAYDEHVDLVNENAVPGFWVAQRGWVVLLCIVILAALIVAIATWH